MKVNNKSYLGKVINALGVQAARNFKTKRGLVEISELVSGLKAFKTKEELVQLKSSINYLIQNGLVKLVLPEFVKKTLKKIGMGTEFCGSCCDSGCRPRLSIGVVYDNNGLPINQMCGSCGPRCGPCGSSCGPCGSCGEPCRPRLSIGVVYPTDEINQLAGKTAAGMNKLAPQFKQGSSGVGVSHSSQLGLNQMRSSCVPSWGSCKPPH